MNSLTFIIPTYNSSLFIEQCLRSIINLNLEIYYEIIVIDDASTDNSVDIVNKIIKNNPHIEITLITNSENKGVSYTRNVGINNARYEYISFVDSDDTLINNPIIKNESILNDIYIFNFLENNMLINIEKYELDYHNNGKKLISYYFQNPVGNSIFTYVWGKIYRKDFLNNYQIRFDEDKKIHEDIIFNIDCFYFTNNIRYLNKTIYNYIVNKSQYKFNIENIYVFESIYRKGCSRIADIKNYKSQFYTNFIVKNIILISKSGQLKIIYEILEKYKVFYLITDHKIIKNYFVKFIFKYNIVKLTSLSTILLYFYFL